MQIQQGTRASIQYTNRDLGVILFARGALRSSLYHLRDTKMRPDEADTGGTYMGEHTWLMAALMYGIM